MVCGPGAHAQQRRLDLPQPFVIAADPDSGVVVEERLGEPHDRVGERLGVGGRLVGTGRDLRLDHVADERHRARLHDPGARGQQPHRARALLLEEPAQRRERERPRLMRSNTASSPGSSAAAHAAPFAVDQPLELVGDHLAEQRLARPEPAVDRRAAQAELARTTVRSTRSPSRYCR